jgi:hypothetical protein
MSPRRSLRRPPGRCPEAVKHPKRMMGAVPKGAAPIFYGVAGCLPLPGRESPTAFQRELSGRRACKRPARGLRLWDTVRRASPVRPATQYRPLAGVKICRFPGFGRSSQAGAVANNKAARQSRRSGPPGLPLAHTSNRLSAASWRRYGGLGGY